MNTGKTSWTMFKISSVMQTNSFISLLRQMPLLSGLVPESIYRKTGVKYLFSLGGIIKGFIGSLLGSTMLCLFLFDWLPAWLGVEPTKMEIVLLCIIVKGVVPNLRSCGMLQANEKDYIFLNHFMMNPAEYYHYKIGKEALEKAVVMLPVMSYFLRDVGLVLLVVSAELLCIFGGGCFHLWMYDGSCRTTGKNTGNRKKTATIKAEMITENITEKGGTDSSKGRKGNTPKAVALETERDARRIRNRRIRNAISAVIVLLMYVLLVLGGLCEISLSSLGWLKPDAVLTEETASLLVSVSFSALFLAAALFCYRKLFRYQDYKRIAVEFANKEAVLLSVTVNAPAGEEGVDALQSFNAEKNREFYEKNKALNTAEYLNKAFFTRFHSVFANQRNQILGLGLVLGLFLGYLVRVEVLHITEGNALSYTPMLISLTGGLMLFGQRFTTLCFRFVDMPMLYHHLCGKEYLKKSMKVRYLFLVRHCLVALLGLSLFLAALLFVSGLKLPAQDILLVIVTMGLYMLTNELYNLTVYYLIQPYTVDISVKSPVYKVLSMVESLFDISALFLRGNLARVVLPMLGVFLLVNVMFLVTAGRVEKTFRLRN